MKGNREVASDQLKEALAQLGDLIEKQAFIDLREKTGRIEQAKRELANRADEKKRFLSGVVSEASWRMLLDLYIADHEKSRVSVTSLCIASEEPQTTALRWISLLEDHGYVIKEADIADARRKFVALSDFGRITLDEYFLDRPFHLI